MLLHGRIRQYYLFQFFTLNFLPFYSKLIILHSYKHLYFELSIMATTTNNINHDESSSNKDEDQMANLLSWKTEKNKNKDEEPQQIVILSNGQGIYLKQSTQKRLQERFIYSKMIGVNSSSKNIYEFVCEPFLIDRYSCAFVIENNIMPQSKNSNAIGVEIISKLRKDHFFKGYDYLLKKRQLFLLDGHKFGSDFIGYEHYPDLNHGNYLVFIETNKKSIGPDSHISRLSTISKKIGLIISISLNQQQQIQIYQEQMQPRIIENRRTVKSTVGTRELLTLKTKLGWRAK